jgi:dTDP-4-dehydrorhamnose reductase
VRALITGSGGQVGHQLELTKPAGATILGLTRAQCDIGDRAAVVAAVQGFRPDVIINAAAYTNVDGAESDKESAFRINGDGAANVVHAADQASARVVHISTDYVFDGHQSTPYSTSSRPAPLGVYGASKLAGEEAVLSSDVSVTIVRTGWVYAETGRNFVRTILRLLDSGKSLTVVSDQLGTPTYAHDLAVFLWKCAERPPEEKLLHWTNSGIASWYDLAVAIQELARERRIIDSEIEIKPVRSTDYHSAAQRPAYSVLDSFLAWNIYGVARHWRSALASSLDKLAELGVASQHTERP